LGHFCFTLPLLYFLTIWTGKCLQYIYYIVSWGKWFPSKISRNITWKVDINSDWHTRNTYKSSMILGVGVVFLEVLSRFVSHTLNLKHQVEDCKDSKVFWQCWDKSLHLSFHWLVSQILCRSQNFTT
jgi:hypothetical protein